MTTVACSLLTKSMAVDARITGGVISHARKIKRVGDSLFGVAGAWEACYQFLEWIEVRNDRPDLSDEDFEAVELTRSGIFIYHKALLRVPVLDKYFATGSGAQGAMVAMSLGCTPKQAVKAVALFDESTGAPFLELTLNANPKT